MITTTPFGTAPSGSPVTVYNLVCAGARVRVMDYGATILGIEVPDASGDVADIVLGFDASMATSTIRRATAELLALRPTERIRAKSRLPARSIRWHATMVLTKPIICTPTLCVAS